MGANMQRQAVPLIQPRSPWVGTGMEYKSAHDSGAALLCKHDGVVEFVDAKEIRVRRDNGALDKYMVTKFRRSNSGTSYNQRPIVHLGEKVEKRRYFSGWTFYGRRRNGFRAKRLGCLHDMGRLQLRGCHYHEPSFS